MLGLYVKEPKTIELKEFPATNPLKGDEVKIKLIYGGICGSDVSVYKGRMEHASYPVRPGHELIGTIVEAGEHASHEVGQRVVIEPNSYCGTCDYCKAGKTNICEKKESLGVNKDGGFSEEFIVSSKYVLPVPEDLSDEKAVLIEPFAVIVHAFEKVTINENTSIAIIGCGTEGMLGIALADYLGATITAVDISEEKLAKVSAHYPNVKIVLPQAINGETFDIVIEAAGAKSSFEQGAEIVKPGGSMVIVGMAPEANVPVIRLVRKEISLFGSIIYNVPQDFQKSIEYLSREDFRVESVISKVYPFKDYNKAYEDALSGHYGKIILDFKEEQKSWKS